MNEVQEIWKPIDGYEGIYEVSSFGNVRGLKGLRHPSVWNQYKVVTLRKGGETKTVYVHRLVATAFSPNPLNKPCVNHIDCNKANNRADNLEWCTRQENELHAWAHGLKEKIRVTSRANAENARRHIHNKIPVTQLSENREAIAFWESASDAAKALNIDGSAITKCCRGKSKRVGGFKWQYTEQ